MRAKCDTLAASIRLCPRQHLRRFSQVGGLLGREHHENLRRLGPHCERHYFDDQRRHSGPSVQPLPPPRPAVQLAASVQPLAAPRLFTPGAFLANPTQRFVFLSSAGQPFPTPVYPPVVGGTSIDSTIKNIYNAIEPWVQWGFEVAAYAVDAVDQTATTSKR